MKYPVCEKLKLVYFKDEQPVLNHIKFFNQLSYEDVLELEHEYDWDGKSNPSLEIVEQFLQNKNPYLVEK